MGLESGLPLGVRLNTNIRIMYIMLNGVLWGVTF